MPPAEVTRRPTHWVSSMVQAGAIPLTAVAYLSELQRDGAREASVPAVLQTFEQHGGGFGSALRWEWDLLGLKEGTR